jgi:hypothetical protein
VNPVALQLPTDTASLRLETKQYELFNKRLGNGIHRRVLTISVAVAVPWVSLLLLVGVPLFSRFGPQAYIVPPFILVYRAIRRDESGRMAAMGWYDNALAHKPSRRRPLRNPLLPGVATTARRPQRLTVTTLLQPGERT